MKHLYNIMGSILLMGIMLMWTGCVTPPTTITDLNFVATNSSAEGEKKPSAKASGIINLTVTTTFTIIINGQPTVITTKTKGNELPVMAGNEVEIIFTPSCPEETEAFFTLPDGKTQKVTASTPSFKWTVPENFTPGMEINGKSSYKKDEAKYKASGKIILVDVQREE